VALNKAEIIPLQLGPQLSTIRIGNQPTQMPNSTESKVIFTGESVDSLRDLGDTLQRVHRRLLGQGYILKGGKYVAPTN